MQKKGFTLIELLIVIGIIGMIGTLSTFAFSSSHKKAKISRGLSYEQSVLHVVGDDAVAIWNFDECSGTAAIDSSGNQRDAILIGPPDWSTDSPSNKGCSLLFNGSSDQIDPNFNWTFQHQNFTLSAWYKTKKSAEQVIFMIGDENVLEMLNGKLRVNLSSNTANAVKKTNDNAWHFVAITGDSGSIRVYVDGKNTPDITIAGDTDSYSGQMLVGRCTGGSWYFSGSIDNMRIYQRALTSMELQKIYAEGKSNQTVAEK